MKTTHDMFEPDLVNTARRSREEEPKKYLGFMKAEIGGTVRTLHFISMFISCHVVISENLSKPKFSKTLRIGYMYGLCDKDSKFIW